LRHSLSTTADVSKELWHEFKNANIEMAKDIKHGVHDIRESWQGTDAKSSSEVASSSGALDSAFCDDDLVEIGSANHLQPELQPKVVDRRTSAERRYDEQSDAAVKNVKAIVHHTAQLSEGLWRRASHGVKKGLRSFGTTTEEVDQRNNDEFPFWMLPSSRANYVKVYSGVALPRVRNGAESTQTNDVDLHDARTSAGLNYLSEIQSSPLMSSTVGSITKLGGFAKRSKEASSDLFRQAFGFSQDSQSSATVIDHHEHVVTEMPMPGPLGVNTEELRTSDCKPGIGGDGGSTDGSDDDIFEIGVDVG